MLQRSLAVKVCRFDSTPPINLSIRVVYPEETLSRAYPQKLKMVWKRLSD
jgi:hypothetical protein